MDEDILYDRWNRWDDEEGCFVMTSPDLQRYFDMFLKTTTRPGPRPSFGWWDSIFRKILNVVDEFTKRFEQDFLADPNAKEPVSLRILWSITMLGQLLTNITMRRYNVDTYDLEQWPDGSLIDQRMKFRGWCPQEISRLTNVLSMDSFYSLTLMSWWSPKRGYFKLPGADPSQELEELALETGKQSEGEEGPTDTRYPNKESYNDGGEQLEYKLWKT